MLRSLRFYYRFLVHLITRRYRQIFLLSIFFLVLLITVRFLSISFFPDIFSQVTAKINKASFNEGVVGSVSTLNPVYASTLAEEEINSLVFRGLTRIDDDGSVVLDLAESFERESSTKYIFTLKRDLYWHDGQEITSDDVVHTIKLTQNPNPPSPFASNFKGVKVTKIDNYTVEFILNEALSPFIQNTTLGIVPEHISLEKYRPIGSGDFKVTNIFEDKIVLESDYLNLAFKLYKSKEDALLSMKLGEIDGLGGLSFFELNELSAWPNLKIFSSNLAQRQIVLFMNLNDDLLKEKRFRQLLSKATSKELVTQILPGFSLIISETSLPLKSWADNSFKNPIQFDIDEAKKDLDALGWKLDGEIRKNSEEELNITITTTQDPELDRVLDRIKDNWVALGIKVEVLKLESIELREKAIPERDFQVLLSVQQLGVDPDQYSIWHSSQINDGNITGLQSDKIDKILEDGRKIFKREERKDSYAKFNRILADEAPAIFLYYPKYFWIVNKKIENIKLRNLILTSDRFKNISEWKINKVNIFN